MFENHILYGRVPSDRLNSSLSCCSVGAVLGQVIREETQSVVRRSDTVKRNWVRPTSASSWVLGTQLESRSCSSLSRERRVTNRGDGARVLFRTLSFCVKSMRATPVFYWVNAREKKCKCPIRRLSITCGQLQHNLQIMVNRLPVSLNPQREYRLIAGRLSPSTARVILE